MESISWEGFARFFLKQTYEKLLNDSSYGDFLQGEYREMGIEGNIPDFLKDSPNPKGQTMNPNFLTLLIGDLAFNTPNTTKQHSFILSKALIHESLEFPFSIECEGYIETIKDNVLDKSQDLNPKNLISQPAIFSIKNPSKLLNNRPNKVYSGILSNVKYLGFETLENSLNHRHFFHFKVESVLIKMSLNKANRIYIDLITQCNDILPSLAKIA